MARLPKTSLGRRREHYAHETGDPYLDGWEARERYDLDYRVARGRGADPPAAPENPFAAPEEDGAAGAKRVTARTRDAELWAKGWDEKGVELQGVVNE